MIKKPTAGTYAAFAQSEANEAGGRFARQTPQHVVGSTPVQQYPAAAHQQSDPVGPEPPLGFSINDMVPVGEVFEQSLGEVRPGEGVHSSHDAASASPGETRSVDHPSALQRPRRPSRKKER